MQWSPIECVYLRLYEKLFIGAAAPHYTESGQLLLAMLHHAAWLPAPPTLKHAVVEISKILTTHGCRVKSRHTKIHTHNVPHTRRTGRPHWEWYEVPGVIVLHFVHPGHLPALPVFKWVLQTPSIAAGYLFIYFESLHHSSKPGCR